MIIVPEGYVTIVLVTLTLLLQSIGMAVLIEWIKGQFPHGIRHLGLFRSIMLVVRFTSLLVCLHMLEILLWASFYRWKSFATWEAAFYFSAASYSTVGSGDLFLKQMWRTMGPVESVTGVLMCGLSASFVFAIVNRLVEHETPNPPHGAAPYETRGLGKQPRSRQPETGHLRCLLQSKARTAVVPPFCRHYS
ncbi:MAG: potassium channel family protein [Terriglobales bacterium]